MSTTEQNAGLTVRMAAVVGTGRGPLSVSVATGEVRSVTDRVERLRATHPSASRGSCLSGYSTWGD
ncbi:hypothetical protein [Streptomyces durocortorensis]|uniref:Uncharacterized protein n=1 Tax=Streptomyces durocortorensis TaxID=2811104 RepID=A0ABS2HUH0_9ACTN|nr:hypothetical protein [Streptomyces durocortorensis]MBM7053167.1 hypothetical protein [Streptomyces durocortorensis]